MLDYFWNICNMLYISQAGTFSELFPSPIQSVYLQYCIISPAPTQGGPQKTEKQMIFYIFSTFFRIFPLFSGFFPLFAGFLALFPDFFNFFPKIFQFFSKIFNFFQKFSIFFQNFTNRGPQSPRPSRAPRFVATSLIEQRFSTNTHPLQCSCVSSATSHNNIILKTNVLVLKIPVSCNSSLVLKLSFVLM